MSSGFTRDGAVQDQIDATIADAIERARREVRQGPSREYCLECEEEISPARRVAVPGVQLCVPCAKLVEREKKEHSTINRRAPMDSNLR